jgi:hypothetical protein
MNATKHASHASAEACLGTVVQWEDGSWVEENWRNHGAPEVVFGGEGEVIRAPDFGVELHAFPGLSDAEGDIFGGVEVDAEVFVVGHALKGARVDGEVMGHGVLT